MAGTTTNNGWTYPTSTDYVKDGATAIQTLATGIDTSTGNGLKAWTAYTPTLTGITLGSGGTSTFKYAQLGKIVFVRGVIALGTGGTVTGPADFSVPVSAQVIFGGQTGYTQYYNGTNIWPGTCIAINSSTVRMQIINAAGTYAVGQDLSSTVPFSWTTGATRQLIIFATYEAV